VLTFIHLPLAAGPAPCQSGAFARPCAMSRPSAAAKVRDSGAIPGICLTVFTAAWVALAIHPHYREDWILENLLTCIGVPTAVLTYRRFRFSDQAYIQATIFLLLHTVGSHYTYSEVPAGEWIKQACGLTRNHYDRVVHFGFGLLMLRPVRELALRKRDAVGRVALFYLSFAAVVSWSAGYEIIESLVAAIVDPAAGTAYLGTQGDVWDSQKDMGLACVGALIGAAIDGWQSRTLVGERLVRDKR
jgi:putative membrane protein